jgi:hypothetical protein
MPIFNLSSAITVSAFTVVEADTLEAAIEIAEGRQAVIGGINSGESKYESWIVEEADGEPQDIRVMD